MKKNSLLKAIGIAFLAYVLLSWIIPTGYFTSGKFTGDSIVPVGILDLIRYPLITSTSSVFVLTGLVILVIGGLYGVLNKTLAYQSMINSITKKFKNKETKFLVITVLLFALLSSVTGLSLPLFVMVPMFATIIILLGYSKFTAMLSTVGAVLVGNIGSTYGFNVAGYITYLTEDINKLIIFRIILFVVTTSLLLFTVIKSSKKENNKEEIILFEKTKEKTKKSFVPMIVTLIIMMLLILIGMFNWSGVFKIEFFGDIYTKISEFSLGGYPVAKNIIGSTYGMGSWTNYELCLVLIISSLVIGLIYKLKLREIVESFVEGSKKMLPVAFYTVLASIIFLLMNSSSTGYTIFATITNALLDLTKGFNVITFSIVSFIGSFLYNDFPYLLSSIYDPITNLYQDKLPIIGIITQSIHGLVQLIAPTSIILVAGLKYFDISYSEWFKKIIKFLLFILLVIIVIIIIITLV